MPAKASKLMEPPIIANNKGDVLIFDSVEKAERYLEPIDIRNDEDVIYDREGRLLRGAIVGHFLGEHVRLEPASEAGSAVRPLHDVLVDFLAQVGARIQKPLDRCSLQELLTEMDRFKTE
jgi:hypothetical protein